MDYQWLQTQFRRHPEKTKAELARALNLDAPAVSKMLSGARQIKAPEYVAMRKFFGLPTDGEGYSQHKGNKDNYVIGALADSADDDQDDGAWVMPAHLFQNRTKAAPDNIKIYDVSEDALEPEIARGEQVLVDLSDKMPSPAGAFVISDGVGQVVRRCEIVPNSSPTKVRVFAVKDRYAEYEIDLDKAQVIGRVIARLQWL